MIEDQSPKTARRRSGECLSIPVGTQENLQPIPFVPLINRNKKDKILDSLSVPHPWIKQGSVFPTLPPHYPHFLGKNSNGSFLLQLDGCWLGFQLRVHIVKCCISIIWSELLGNWEISSGTLKTTIAMVKLIFFRRKDICVTIHSLLR